MGIKSFIILPRQSSTIVLLSANTLDTHLSAKCSDVLDVASLDGVVEGLSTEGVGRSCVVAADNRTRRVGAVVLVRARTLTNLIKLPVDRTSRIINLHTAIAVLSPAY